MACWLQDLLSWFSSPETGASGSPLPPTNVERKRIGSSETTVTTVINSSRKTFNWRILDFDKICPSSCKEFARIESPVFTAGKEVGVKSEWCLSIEGKWKEISCFLELISVNGKSCWHHRNVTSKYKIYFGNNENPHKFTGGSGSSLFTPESNIWGFRKFISIPKLYEMKFALLRNNTLHICVEIEIFGDPKEEITLLPPPIKRLKRSISTAATFLSDFRQLLNNKKHADFEIVCGSKTFCAHKNILSARSKVFKAMFDSDMKESSTNQIIISDMDSDAVYSILEYIYTGQVVLNESTSFNGILYGAEKYDLLELKQLCFNKMLDCVTDETIGTLAVAVDIYNADEETKKVVTTYCQRNIDTLGKIPSFQKLLIAHPRTFPGCF